MQKLKRPGPLQASSLSDSSTSVGDTGWQWRDGRKPTPPVAFCEPQSIRKAWLGVLLTQLTGPAQWWTSLGEKGGTPGVK